jgi:hypothetical protein
VIVNERIEVVGDCEARACEFAKVHAARVAQVIESQGRLIAQPCHKLEQTFAFGDDGNLIRGFYDFFDCVCEFRSN